MKGFGKALVVLLSGLLVAGLFVGCAPAAKPEQKPVETERGAEKVQEPPKYPTRTINIIVPWPPGGRTDTWIRALARPLEKELGVPVVVSNHSGAAGVIGARAVAAAGADGYTIGAFALAHVMAEFMKDPPFDTDKYSAIGAYTTVPYGVAVHADAPWKSLREFIDHAKANPGRVKHGTTGTGVEDHIFSEYIYQQEGARVTMVPYAGDAPAVTALLGKEVDVILMGLPPLMPHHEAGSIRVLAVSSEKRFPLTLDIPTFLENGVNFVGGGWNGLFVPVETPGYVQKILETALANAIKDPEFVKIMKDLKSPIIYQDRQALTKQIESDREILRTLVKELGLKP